MAVLDKPSDGRQEVQNKSARAHEESHTGRVAPVDLESKLVDFQEYYNEHRTHAGRPGGPPAPSLETAGARMSL